MVTNYEFIKKEEGCLRSFISRGIVSVNYMSKTTMYEYYLSERKTENKMQSYQNTAEHYNTSEKTIERIVYWMESSL